VQKASTFCQMISLINPDLSDKREIDTVILLAKPPSKARRATGSGATD